MALRNMNARLGLSNLLLSCAGFWLVCGAASAHGNSSSDPARFVETSKPAIRAPSLPIAVVSPLSVALSAPANEMATANITISNSSNSQELLYSTPVSVPPTALSAAQGYERPSLAGNFMRAGAAEMELTRLSKRSSPSTVFDAVPSSLSETEDSLSFVSDDGSIESALAHSDGVAQHALIVLNRFIPATGIGAFTVDSIAIQWPSMDLAGGDLAGKQINLVAYYDADGDGDPSNATRLGDDVFVTINSADAVDRYATDFHVPGAGDVYVGYEESFALGGISSTLSDIGLDQGMPLSDSYLAGKSQGADPDLNTLSNNDLLGTVADVTAGLANGNFMIRATGNMPGGATNCVSPPPPWLSVAPSLGSVDVQSSASVQVTVDPNAGGLLPGDYVADVCITTNDPNHPLVDVSVGLSVTAPSTSVCVGADDIFCDGFDDASEEPKRLSIEEYEKNPS